MWGDILASQQLEHLLVAGFRIGNEIELEIANFADQALLIDPKAAAQTDILTRIGKSALHLLQYM